MKPSEPETLEQIAERLAGAYPDHRPVRTKVILAALREVEARARTEAGQKARDEAARVHSGLAATIVQEERRAEKAEAEMERLRVERDEAWAAANSAEAKVAQLREARAEAENDILRSLLKR